MSRSAFITWTAAILLASAARAQLPVAPRPSLPSSGPVTATVVDAVSAEPLAGVRVVARWEWIDWIPPRLHGGRYYHYAGAAAHVAEGASDERGAVHFAGWRALPRADGRMAPGQPRLLFFRPGYEPLAVTWQSLGGAPARLRRFDGTPRQYAEAIAGFQGEENHGLAWLHPDGAARTPQMTLAIHRETLRLGADRGPIRGAHLLPGYSGRGEVVDADTGGEVRGAIISIAWIMRPADGGEARRRFVQQKSVGADGSPAVAYVSAWRAPGPPLEGWIADESAEPRVRVYALGYRTSPEAPWPLRGAVVRMERLPEGNEAKLAQLREWRREIDAFVAAGDAAFAASQYALLAWKLQGECERLTPDLRTGLCHGRETVIGRAVHALRTQGVLTLESHEGVRDVPIVAAGTPAPQWAARAASGGHRMYEPVRGFAIEPVSP